MPTRLGYLSVTFNGSALTNVLSASCTYSWRRNVPEATVFVRANPFPGSQPYDTTCTIDMGAGTNNVTRFSGVFRQYNFALWPRALGLVFRGHLVRAEEYQNHDDPRHIGGLALFDLLASETATDADVVTAVLSLAGLTGTSIGGTGVTWGSRGLLNPLSYIWRAGTGPLFGQMAGAGQSALDYIQSWDKVSAVYTSDTDPVGFYRTYETVNGIYRALIGGRPRSTADWTFSEGIDIEPGATTSRQYPLANAAFVSGFDPGLGIGPVRNMDFDATAAANQGGNVGAFLGQSSNPFQTTARSVTYDFNSPFIEWGTEAEAGIGMNCERVGNALLADLNRETVNVRFRTWRDYPVQPGDTILVQGPGGAVGWLGVGEKLWVDDVTNGVDENMMYYQEIVATGGGPEDGATPAPPG